MNPQRGQVSLMATVITAISMVAASALTGWTTATSSIAVVQERENNHYMETQKDLNRIESKVDEQAKDLKNIGVALHIKER